MAYDALTISKWFASWADANEADLSPLKMQKLLYYAQGHHLAAFDEPLFDDPIAAWSHGPVVRSIYQEYRQFGSGDIRLSDDDPFDWDDVDERTTDLLIDVWNVYGGFGAWKLRNMTHAEPPWKNAFDSTYDSAPITIDAMRSHFCSN